MATAVETLGKLERRMTISFPLTDVRTEVEKRLKKQAKTAKAPGFRPGKVPMKMVAAQYGYQIESDVLNDRVGRAFNDAANENALRVAGFPKIEPKEDSPEGVLSFDATFEVYPEVVVGDLSGVEIEGIADERAAVERTRAFVKVQDGCSFFCTYCIIPAARGPERSLAPDVVLGDVRRALAAGHREIVLTGINIGTYDGGWSERGARGSHVRSALTLAGLVRRILDETTVERIRLSSIEPQHVDDELLRAWVDGAPRTLPHVHLPLQSGDDGVLRRMGRRYVSADYASTVARIRAAIPGVAIHGDAIVGFPTEDGAAWQRSLAFIRSIDFAGLHVFRYSARPGTAATRMRGQVDEATKKRRAAELLALAAEGRARWAARQVGTAAGVLFERRLADGRWTGHAETHVLVAVDDPEVRENEIRRVRLVGVDPTTPDRLIGIPTPHGVPDVH